MDNESNKKHFTEWIGLKEKLHFGNSAPRISEGDIWWCSCGENVGIEINGKSKLFSRPVFVYKKLGHLGFIGIPLTSQSKSGSWYVKIDFQGKNQTAVLSQIRTFSISRLSSRMVELDLSDIQKIKKALLNFLK